MDSKCIGLCRLIGTSIRWARSLSRCNKVGVALTRRHALRTERHWQPKNRTCVASGSHAAPSVASLIVSGVSP